jgi:hypothetical protein
MVAMASSDAEGGKAGHLVRPAFAWPALGSPRELNCPARDRRINRHMVATC